MTISCKGVQPSPYLHLLLALPLPCLEPQACAFVETGSQLGLFPGPLSLAESTSMNADLKAMQCAPEDADSAAEPPEFER